MDSSRKKSTRVTILDVARESGVSYSTVSRALNGFDFVKGATRDKVLAAAEKLGYVANVQARSLAGGKTRIIGLLVPGLDNGYIGEIVRGVDEEIAKANYDLMLYTTRRRVGREAMYIDAISNGPSDGIILIVPLLEREYLTALREHHFPYVLVDQIDPQMHSPMVDATNWQGAYDATKYLIDLGHRRIGFITGLRAIQSALDRLDGYKAALADHGVRFDETLIAEGDFFTPGGYAAAQKLLKHKPRPTAVFASNDLMALGAMQAIRDQGLEIPEDISVLGFDDIPQASMVHPQLTTVRQPLEQMGRVAVSLLIEQIERPDNLERAARRVTLATRLIERESCAAVPTSDMKG
ncbi:MAG: LacI family DNA-binding transcriptional regulator [Anaerolineae bacterium]|nr:LacI family DNA-binding transcriptional regulator [Anaerolineae bacterium]